MIAVALTLKTYQASLVRCEDTVTTCQKKTLKNRKYAITFISRHALQGVLPTLMVALQKKSLKEPLNFLKETQKATFLALQTGIVLNGNLERSVRLEVRAFSSLSISDKPVSLARMTNSRH